PLKYRPAFEVILRKLGENSAEINLAIAKRAETSGTLDPRLVSAVNTLAAARPKLGVLHVEHFDPLVINVDELQVIELLQNKVTGVKKNVATFVPVESIEEHLKADAVVQVFAGVQFETEVDAGVVKQLKNRFPSFCQLVERSFNQPWRPLRPRVDVGPRQCTRERNVRLETK